MKYTLSSNEPFQVTRPADSKDVDVLNLKTSDLDNDLKFVSTNCYMGTCATAAATDPKVCTVQTFPTTEGGAPLDGIIVCVKYAATDTSTTTTPTINVNGTGAKRIWYGSSLLATAKSTAHHGYKDRYIYYAYDSSLDSGNGAWVWLGAGYDANSTYSNVSLGQGYTGAVGQAADVVAKTAALSSYALTTGGIVTVTFTNGNTAANPTLNINSKGAKAIYFRGAACPADLIQAGDVVTMIYNGTYYHIISIARRNANALGNDGSNTLQLKDNSTVLSSQEFKTVSGNSILGSGNIAIAYGDVTGTPTIPSAPGTLNTTATTAQSTAASEALSGSVTLHKVAKTGTYSDLIGTPSLATVATSGSYSDLSNKPTIPAAPGTLSTNNTTAQTVPSSAEALSGAIKLHKIAKTGTYSDLIGTPSLATVATSGSYNDLSNKPTIPSAPGTLVTNKTTAQTASAGEAMSGTINLHKVAKTGTYSDLIGTPSLATVATSGDYGDLSNTPTIPTVGTLTTNASTAQTAVASESLSGAITLHKVSKTGSYNDLNNLPNLALKANLASPTFTGTPKAPTATAGTNSTQIATTEFVQTAVQNAVNDLPEPMIFKGTVGTNGTITTLPTAAATNEGHTYKVISALSSPAAKIGDTVISNGSSWVVIPSGDEPSGTVTSVGMTVPTGLSISGSPITSSGTLAVTYASGYSIPTTSKQTEWDSKQAALVSGTNIKTVNSNSLLGSGNISIATPGTLNTNNATAQTVPTSAEALSGTIKLHKIAKTGTYSDLIGTPTLATVATSGSYNDLTNKPTIPTVNNAALTIQKNGTNVATFTANASSNATANITVPTATSDLTNDSGFLGDADVSYDANTKTLVIGAVYEDIWYAKVQSYGNEYTYEFLKENDNKWSVDNPYPTHLGHCDSIYFTYKGENYYATEIRDMVSTSLSKTGNPVAVRTGSLRYAYITKDANDNFSVYFEGD